VANCPKLFFLNDDPKDEIFLEADASDYDKELTYIKFEDLISSDTNIL